MRWGCQIYGGSPFWRTEMEGDCRTVSSLHIFFFNVYISTFRSWMFEFFINSFQSPLPWTTCNNYWNSKNCHGNLASLLENQHTSQSYFKASVTVPINTTAASTGIVVFDNATKMQNNASVSPGDDKGFSAAEEFCQYRVLELSGGIDEFGWMQWKYVLYHLLTRIIVVACCYKSIKSIEKVMVVTMLGPTLISLAIFIRSLTLPGSYDGIKVFFLPDFARLVDQRVWIEAALAAFYALALGWGGIILLGSHARFHEDSVRTAASLTVVDSALTVFNGLVCFSVLGSMAHAAGTPVVEVVNAGVSAGIVAYPSAIAELPAPQVWSCLFFTSLLLLGLDNQVVSVEMTVQVLQDTFPKLLSRRRTLCLILVNVAYFMFGLILCNRAGGYIFLFLDWYNGVWLGPIVVLIELVVVCWIYGGDRFSYDVSLMIGRPVPAFLRISLAFTTPIFVLILLILSIANYKPPVFGEYSYPAWAQCLGWILVALNFSPVLIYIIYYASVGGGSTLQNLRKNLKPRDTWGPAEDSLIETYNNRPLKRSVKDLLLFNMFGSSPNSSHKARKCAANLLAPEPNTAPLNH